MFALYPIRPRRISYDWEPTVSYTQAPVDPAVKARQRLVRAMNEQQAARKAYAELLAEREFTSLEAEEPFDFFDPFTARQWQLQQAEEQRRLQHELAIRAKREVLVRAHREKVAREEAARRQQVVEARRRQLVLEARRQQERVEAQRRAVAERRQQAEAVVHAIALARAFAEQFYAEQESVAPASQPTQVDAEPRRVRFADPSTAKAAPTVPIKATAPTTTAASTSSTPVRISIRESKGKATSHVRVNSREAAPTSPADALAALAILDADLDGLLDTAHVFHSPAHRRHALNQLLEQIDSVESGGEEAVRDMRRALVRRVERVLEGEADEPRKQTGVRINEPVKDTVDVQAVTPSTVIGSTTVAAVASEVDGYDIPDFIEPTTSPAADAAVKLPDAVVETESVVEATPASEWQTVDPTHVERVVLDKDAEVPSEPAAAAETVDSPAVPLIVEEVVTQSAPTESTEHSEQAKADVEATVSAGSVEQEAREDSVDEANGVDAFVTPSPATSPEGATRTLPQTDRLSDWESAKGSDDEAAFEML